MARKKDFFLCEGIKDLVNLKTLDLSCNRKISDQAFLRMPAGQGKLKFSEVRASALDRSSETCEGIKHLINLKTLNLRHNSKISDDTKNKLKKRGVKISV